MVHKTEKFITRIVIRILSKDYLNNTEYDRILLISYSYPYLKNTIHIRRISKCYLRLSIDYQIGYYPVRLHLREWALGNEPRYRHLVVATAFLGAKKRVQCTVYRITDRTASLSQSLIDSPCYTTRMFWTLFRDPLSRMASENDVACHSCYSIDCSVSKVSSTTIGCATSPLQSCITS
jgi:hypothetical protein